MTDREWDDAAGQMLIDFECLVPCTISNPRDESLVHHFDQRRRDLETMTTDQRRTVSELMAEAFEMGDRFTREPTVIPPTVKTNPELARALFNACRALTYGTPADGPLPPNTYHVTRHTDGMVSFYFVGAKGPAAEVLNLAVWLIALADPTLSNAVPMLLRVATR